MQSQSLIEFLAEKRVTNGHKNYKSHTVRGLGSIFGGCYYITDKEYRQFLKLLHDYIFLQKQPVNLVEVHRDLSPILIDLDFRYDGGGILQRRFTNEQVRDFCREYTKLLGRFFDLTQLDEPLRFFVQMKPAPEKCTKSGRHLHKDGVHIICPDVTLSPAIQFALRGAILESDIINKVFGSTGINNPSSEIFDRCVIATNGWFFYGGCKPDQHSYSNVAVYLVEANQRGDSKMSVDSIDSYTTLELVELLSIRLNHTQETQLVPYEKEVDNWNKLIHSWEKDDPSSFKAVKPSSNASSSGGTQFGGSGATNDSADAPISVRAVYTKDDIDMALRLARECLDPMVRAKEFTTWIDLGLCLYNISDTTESINTWIDISKRVEGYENESEYVFYDKWKQFRNTATDLQKQIKMGTLYHWVKQDNPSRYEQIRNEDIVDYAYNHDSGTHGSIANLMVRLFRHDYRCCAVSKTAMHWYVYQENCWRQIKLPIELRSSISNRVRDIFVMAEIKALKLSLETSDQNIKDSIMEKKKRIAKIMQNLENAGFKDSVMKELQEKFYQEDFISLLNSKPNLVGVRNGVLELDYVNPMTGKKSVLFREGRPDDFISFQVGRTDTMPAIEYKPYDANSVEIKEIQEFFRKLFPLEDLREFVLILLSACLEGRNKEQRFYFMQGEGSNGKSALMRLMEMVFGEYQTSLETTALTRKRPESQSANPDVITLRGKRFVHMQEPEENEKINTSRMKQWSGEDMVAARGLFQDQEKFKIMARIFMACNRLPPVSSTDNGTWRRIRIIKFMSEFRDLDREIDPSKNIYHKDLDMESKKFPAWRQAMLSLLVHYFETKYMDKALIEPPCVAEESQRYKADNDSFAAFLSECMFEDPGAEIELKAVERQYKTWSSTETGAARSLSKQDIRQKMIEKFGKPTDANRKLIFHGVRIATETDYADLSGNMIED